LNKWKCVQVGHHKKIGKLVKEHEKRGWRLHTYQAVRPYMGELNHYLLSKEKLTLNKLLMG
jgi:hypothetical protein